MLFGSVIGLRLEPVSEVSGATFNGPNLDSMSNSVSSGTVKCLGTTHLLDHVGVDGLGKGFLHLFEGVDILTKELGKFDEVVFVRVGGRGGGAGRRGGSGEVADANLTNFTFNGLHD